MLGGFTFIVITIILFIPFCLSIIYVMLGLREHNIGIKENNPFKKRSGLKTILIAMIPALIIFLSWIALLIYVG